MPVMQIRKVEMGMLEFFMYMEMDMPSGNNRGNMFMIVVMVIMAVPMDVLYFDMSMYMRMFLKNNGYYRNGQNQGGDNLNPRELLRKQ